MDKGKNWRPSKKAVAKAKRLLQQQPNERFKVRLRILVALEAMPRGSHSELANLAKTRATVVTRFLERWRDAGVESVLWFGRPWALNSSQQRALKVKLESGAFDHATFQDIKSWIERELLHSTISLAATKACVKRAGFERQRNNQEYKWSPQQLRELENCSPPLQSLALPVLRVGRDHIPVRQAAREGGLKENTLRRLLIRYARMGLDGLADSRQSVRKNFFQWCDSRGKAAPMFEQAQQYFEANGLFRNRRTIYGYIQEWQATRSKRGA